MQEKNTDRFPECWISWTYFHEKLLLDTLQGSCGQSVRILERGELNTGNGPDVMGALLEIDGVCYRGDVEFHVDGRDWFHHGHDSDRRYRSVILHLIWGDKTVPSELDPRFVQVAVQSNLACSFDQWHALMQALDREEASEDGMPFQLEVDELADYADRRFARKVHRLAVWSEQLGMADTAYTTLAVTLGYSRNSAPFRQLLWQRPPSQVFRRFPLLQRSPLLLWSYWCWAAGLIEPSRISENSPLHELTNRFRREGDYPVLSLEDWNFSRLRPSNRPAARLAGLAQILFDFQQPSLFESLLEVAVERQPLKHALQGWMTCLQRPLDQQLRKEVRQLNGQDIVRSIGDERARQCILNGTLPLLTVWGIRNNNPGLCAYLEDIYEQFPRTESPKLAARLAERFDNETVRGLVKKSGFYQQGALEVAATQINQQPAH
ncbi:MAG: DUF2851 family protein [Calditrichia bacterium]